jgi:hypothetical protein
VARDVDLEFVPPRFGELLVQAGADLVEDAPLGHLVPVGVKQVVRLVEERVVEALMHAALDVHQVTRLGRVQLHGKGLRVWGFESFCSW